MHPMLARALGLTRRGGGAASTPAYAVDGNDPKTVADFEAEYYRTGGSDTTFASMFTFARASDATFVDSNGVLQTASSGVARVGHHRYNGSSWVNKGLLLESEARTNIIPDSVPNSTDWSENRTTIQENDANAPDGSTTASFLVQDSSTGAHTTFTNAAVVSGTDYVGSFFVKSNGTTQWVQLATSTGFAVGPFINFDIVNGVVGNVDTFAEYGIEEWGNGWFRIWVSSPATSTGNSIFFPMGLLQGDTNSRFPSFTGDGVSGVHVWGAQGEAGFVPSSHIPTAGATATRAAETLTIAGVDMADSTTAMSFQIDGELDYADEGSAAQQTFFRWRADASNYVSMDLDTDGAATGEVNANQAESGTVDAVVAGAEYTAGLSTAFNIASRNTSGAINVAKDGTAATEDATPTALPDLSATAFELGFDFMGTLARFRQWDVDLGDSGIEEAST